MFPTKKGPPMIFERLGEDGGNINEKFDLMKFDDI